ncbi:hypothetical protein [Halalkalibacterium halodurans]|uniref:hypothetical protein n=1 Tax=Halalkalibacterium halodurans TaxID=86665 RepID=UPI002AA9789B|nr:hypothetical protein [Halalkalibacterium halodurans]MDY7220786.1 hypothetical protein [Halalkalibacterium halodurans]MDY7240025.1 hypothetical protein [Halalkalibacterium halodurans]
MRKMGLTLVLASIFVLVACNADENETESVDQNAEVEEVTEDELGQDQEEFEDVVEETDDEEE